MERLAGVLENGWRAALPGARAADRELSSAAADEVQWHAE